MHLPHHLCVKGFTGDLSMVKCAHYKDGNMTLETPTIVEPFYVTLENPTFSLLGVLFSGWKKIPIHGVVLIYFRILCKDEPDEEHRIHLYLLPYSNQTEQTLKFHSGHQSEPYQSTEISLMGNYLDIQLLVEEVKTKDTIWQATLRKGGEITENIQSRSWPTIHKDEGASSQEEHFVDRHRKTLIENISSIYPVLDELLSWGLLTPEQYDIVRMRITHQQQMRELYGYIRGWGHRDKEILYNALKRYNKSLIRKLESA
ncbi:NACHT, LRR and PYD domains-containing protein 1a allele 5-like [Leptodactylus fuscus]